MSSSIHLNLDDAWPETALAIPCIDARSWGPRVRYFAPEKLLAEFYRSVLAPMPPFVFYGSGDFHHLAGWLIRRVTQPVTLISFDNHPDWDRRPPRWACGGWINRALDLPNVRKVSVWGCGNFELNWPSRLFGNRRDLRSGRLEIHPWAERFAPATARRFDAMTRDNWRQRFESFVRTLSTPDVYATIDLDCLDAGEAVTNWENGLFTAADISWALQILRRSASVIAGDVCGAYSPPQLERWTQRFASRWDHPKMSPIDCSIARLRNLKSLETIWPALTRGASS
jgi:arginase family enzyme